MTLSRVLLPAPLGADDGQQDPGRTRRLTSVSARRSP